MNLSERIEMMQNHLNILTQRKSRRIYLYFYKRDEDAFVSIAINEKKIERKMLKPYVLYHTKITEKICAGIIEISDMYELDVYYIVHNSKNGMRKEADITDIEGLIFDDIKDISADIYKTATIIETSANNYQIMFPCYTTEKINDYKQIQKKAKNILESDKGGSNINQIFRVAGTMNFKHNDTIVKFINNGIVRYLIEHYQSILLYDIEKKISIEYAEKLRKIITKKEYMLLENILGLSDNFKSNSERSMSIVKQLRTYYKVVDIEELHYFFLNSVNEQTSVTHKQRIDETKSKEFLKGMLEKIIGDIIEEEKEQKETRHKLQKNCRTLFEYPSLILSEKPTIQIKIIKDKEIYKVKRYGRMSKKKGAIMLDLISRILDTDNPEFEIKRDDFYKEYCITDNRVYIDIKDSLLEFQIIDEYRIKGTEINESGAVKIFRGFKKDDDVIKIVMDKYFFEAIRENKNSLMLLHTKNILIESFANLKERYSFALLLLLTTIHRERKSIEMSYSDICDKLEIADNKMNRKRIKDSYSEIKLKKIEVPILTLK